VTAVAAVIFFGGLILLWFALPILNGFFDRLAASGVPGRWKTPGLVPIGRGFVVFAFVVGLIALVNVVFFGG